MKDEPSRRVEGPELTKQPQQSPEAALGRPGRPVVINGDLHALLKARAAMEGRPLQVLVESILNKEIGEAVTA